MKILFIADGITPFTIGGMQRHSQNLVKFLLKEGVQIKLGFTVNSDEREPSVEEVFEVLELKDRSLEVKVFKFNEIKKIPGHYIRNSKRMSKNMYNYYKHGLDKVDVIYCKGLLGWEFAVKRAEGELSVPVVSNLHGYEMFQDAPNFKIKIQHILLLRAVTKRILLNSDYTVSYGAKVTSLLRYIGISKVLEIPSGISDEWIVQDYSNRQSGKINVVYLGRYERRKGIQEIHECLEEFNEELADNFSFHFIGPIPTEVRVVRENIYYHGVVRDQADIQKLLDQMDILLCPSYSEGMPNVILESMARGLAIIATNVGAVSLMVSEENGVLLEKPSSEEIRKALNIILKVNINELKSSSLSKIQKFKWSEIAKLTIRELNKVRDETI